MERLTTLLLETLQASRYIGIDSAESKEQNVRRMMRRMQLSSEDAATWLGMLRQILWKLRAKP